MGEVGSDLLRSQWQVNDAMATPAGTSVMMLMMMKMKAVTESVLWSLKNTVAKVFRFGKCS